MPDDRLKLDLSLAHQHFAADCFNRTWELIEKPSRTPDDDEAMILLALTSLWHWTQRVDCTSQNLSIGHWQVSRVFVLVGRGSDAMRHARQCLAYAEGAPPFYVGYAHEAIARSAMVNADHATFQAHLGQAQALAAQVEDPNERQPLEADLQSLKS